MQAKPLDLRKTVKALCTQYPELADHLAEIGFTEIVKPGMLNTAGRVMTIPMGAKMRNIALSQIEAGLSSRGYTVLHQGEEED